MATSDKLFAGSIPRFYDTLMVPLIFEAYAIEMARRVADAAPRAVLETAAGSGVVTRRLAPLLPAAARYVVTDLNQPMLDYARSRQEAADSLEWQQADALQLPFAEASFDAVCCQFGAMFFPDRVAGFAEARRVLRPGGQFFVGVWDAIGVNAFADEVTEAAAEVFPQDPPRFLARTPHGYHDTAQIHADLARAGYADIRIETLERSSRAESARAAAEAYCLGTPLRNEIEARDASLLEAVTERATEIIRQRHGTGAVEGRIQAHIARAC